MCFIHMLAVFDTFIGWLTCYDHGLKHSLQDGEKRRRKEKDQITLIDVSDESFVLLLSSLFLCLFISSWLQMKEHVQQREDDSSWWRGNKRSLLSFLFTPPPPRSLPLSIPHPPLILSIYSFSYSFPWYISLGSLFTFFSSPFLLFLPPPFSLILLPLSSSRSFRALCWNQICHCVFGDRYSWVARGFDWVEKQNCSYAS